MLGINRVTLITLISSVILLLSVIMPIGIKASRVNGTPVVSYAVKEPDKKIVRQSLPLYVSKFWQDISIDDIPNNKRLYNCTATVQMLYAKWLNKVARELGYLSVNEMLEYSSKVMAVKKAIEEIEDPVNFALSGCTGIKYPKETICQLKVSEILSNQYYQKLSKEDAIDSLMLAVGLIDPSWKSATWKVVHLMMENGYAVFQKTDKDGTPAIDIWKESGRHLPLDPTAMNAILPGDIATGKYYATHYQDKYTTHLTVYIGKRDEQPCFAEQFGKDVKITTLNKMYNALRGGFEAVIRPITIISPDKTEKFLATPLSNYEFGSQAMPRILIFKEKAFGYLNPIQVGTECQRHKVGKNSTCAIGINHEGTKTQKL
ncbi:hypothetical protein COZ71_09335 [Candidatus Desantisbacteria bacterium CG_4_8_14_3_um_filter_40_12]|uniref:Uncharacterized protein n=1 Tax=Candidatus Desantisbacteria bacterium CG_4_8_14_3_um_filter_40_12 TaxID=1974545 RepID=A0A2M7J8X5_9BACT|nr:MAG: hypothetical protein COZ71_09335 [Candidatus Desantisbacteria bacterium CG_4_8_14_3_um_filter_40_12]